MVTEAELANMTPEQIAALQKQNCIFCRIIEGKVASKKVFEDDKTIAILDINPANPGHLLILPKEHFAIMPQVPEEILKHLAMVTKALSNVTLKTLKTTGSVTFIANGQLAGQQAPHFMIHLIPRKEGDSLSVFSLPKNKISDEEMNKVFTSISTRLNEMMGVKEKAPQNLDKKDELVKEKKAVSKEEKKEPLKEEEKEAKEEPKPEKVQSSDHLKKENVESLKKFIKSNPELKKKILNNTQEMIDSLKNNPSVRQILTDDEIVELINQIKKETTEGKDDEMDFDGISDLLLGK